jgi:hypothetical protein
LPAKNEFLNTRPLVQKPFNHPGKRGGDCERGCPYDFTVTSACIQRRSSGARRKQITAEMIAATAILPNTLP